MSVTGALSFLLHRHVYGHLVHLGKDAQGIAIANTQLSKEASWTSADLVDVDSRCLKYRTHLCALAGISLGKLSVSISKVMQGLKAVRTSA